MVGLAVIVMAPGVVLPDTHHSLERPDTLIIKGPPPEYPFADVLMMMQVECGWGRCDWTVSMSGGGVVRAKGWVRLEQEGRTTPYVPDAQPFDVTRAVPCDSVLALLDEFYGCDFFAMRPRYGGSRGARLDRDGRTIHEMGYSSADYDKMTLTLQVGSFSRTVEDCGFAPPELHRLADHVLSIAGVDSLIPGGRLSYGTAARGRNRPAWKCDSTQRR